LRDAEYLLFLPRLVKNNPDFTFDVFTIHKSEFSRENITYHAVGPQFKDYMKTASCMITSSGNETIQECVYNEIPIAIFKPTTDLEQLINYNIYVGNGMALPFTEDIDLHQLQNYKYNDTVKFQQMVENAPTAALSLMNRIETNTL
jgi:UDP-N-acetylglucosamine:LPS N-acetylglucosamine transferase